MLPAATLGQYGILLLVINAEYCMNRQVYPLYKCLPLIRTIRNLDDYRALAYKLNYSIFIKLYYCPNHNAIHLHKTMIIYIYAKRDRQLF